MAEPTFSIEMQGLEQLISRISSLPKEAKEQVVADVGAYSEKVLEETQPNPRYVTRKRAYGRTFESDKQRRWFFAALREGRISVPYHRTGALGRGWKVSYQKSAGWATITNSVPYAPFVQGFDQSRHEKLVGWKRLVDIIAGELSFRSSKFRTTCMTAVQKAIRKLRLG
jgi:hypothetical protein